MNFSDQTLARATEPFHGKQQNHYVGLETDDL